MKDQLISFKTAKLAKEKGFDIPLYTSYINGIFHKNQAEPNGYDGWDVPDKENWNKKDWVFTKEGSSCFGCKLDKIKYFEACSASTQSLLQRWLREKYKVYVEVEVITSISNEIAIWLVSVYKKSELIIGISKEHLTYEEALEEGLYEGLKLIK